MKVNRKTLIALLLTGGLVPVLLLASKKGEIVKNNHGTANTGAKPEQQISISNSKIPTKSIDQMRDVLWALNPAAPEFEIAWKEFWANEIEKFSTAPLKIAELKELPFAKELVSTRSVPSLDEKQGALLFLAMTASNPRTDLLVSALKELSTDTGMTERNTIIMSAVTTAAGSVLERAGQFHLEQWAPLLNDSNRCVRFAAAEWVRISSPNPAKEVNQDLLNTSALAEKIKMAAIESAGMEKDQIILKKLIEIAQSLNSEEATDYLKNLYAVWNGDSEIGPLLGDAIQLRENQAKRQ